MPQAIRDASACHAGAGPTPGGLTPVSNWPRSPTPWAVTQHPRMTRSAGTLFSLSVPSPSAVTRPVYRSVLRPSLSSPISQCPFSCFEILRSRGSSLLSPMTELRQCRRAARLGTSICICICTCTCTCPCPCETRDFHRPWPMGDDPWPLRRGKGKRRICTYGQPAPLCSVTADRMRG